MRFCEGNQEGANFQQLRLSTGWLQKVRWEGDRGQDRTEDISTTLDRPLADCNVVFDLLSISAALMLVRAVLLDFLTSDAPFAINNTNSTKKQNVILISVLNPSLVQPGKEMEFVIIIIHTTTTVASPPPLFI